jgi:nucleotide-binding universal stress UspA family protein
MSEAGHEDREEPDETIRRILVALDASSHSLAALQAAADLAARLDAEIQGLYVEDIRLLRLSDHPLARELNFYTPNARIFDRQSAELQLRTQARQARRAMERLADRIQLRWSFRVVQGSVPIEVLNAAEESDLVVMGKVGWSGRRRLGSTTRLVLTEAHRPALILQEGARLSLPVGVVYDGSPAAQRGLAVAAEVMHNSKGFLTVLILAEDVGTARESQALIVQWLRQRDLRARFRWLIRPTGDGLKSLLQAEGCGLMVLPVGSPFFPGDTMADFLPTMECPVMLVR